MTDAAVSLCVDVAMGLRLVSLVSPRGVRLSYLGLRGASSRGTVVAYLQRAERRVDIHRTW